MNRQFVIGLLLGALFACGTLGWNLARAQDAGTAKCMRVTLTSTPAARAEEFMNEQIAGGRIRFVSLAMGGDSPGLMCAW